MNKRHHLTWFETLEARRVLAAAPIITEFVASNNSSAEDGFGADPDWIEIYNSGDEVVDLLGYHLTDDQDSLAKWTFTESTLVEPGEYLLIFASSKDTRDPAGHWHTNFKLSGGGEYLGFSSPTGEMLSQFGTANRDYPPQFTDVSYGLSSTVLLSGESSSEYWIPNSDTHHQRWFLPDFDAIAGGFQTGKAAIGFERLTNTSTSYVPHFETELPSGISSVYVRTEFELEDASAIPDLSLDLLLDDGVVIYLNGTQIYTDQTEPPDWNGSSSQETRDSIVLEGRDLDLSEHTNLLRDGNNLLAFHLLNRTTSSTDLLLVPLLTSTIASDQSGYLARPTPGAPNKNVIELGPSVRNVTLEATELNSEEPLIVTAEVSETVNALDTTNVLLHYRVMFEDEVAVRMFDDGTNGDERANDGIFTGQIPGGVANVGEMVRWYVTASDVETGETREPAFLDSNDSAEYFGTVFPDPTASTDIPVIYWFVRSTTGAQTATGTRASLSIGGEFYDNVKVDLHGQSTTGSDFPKKSFDFDANQGQKFKLADDLEPVSDFNLLTNYGDQTKIRNSLAYGAHEASGGASHFTFPVSIHRNGEFFGLYDIVEEGDTEYLDRIGRDTEGALYKVDNRLSSATVGVDKLTREDEGREDLQSLISATAMSDRDGLIWDYDNLDLADMVNYLAIQAVILNKDFGQKNMYWYHDTNGSELWSILPWDVDLSFGHLYNSTDLYFDDTLFRTGGLEQGLNPLIARMYADPGIRAMYYRRIRTLMDEQLGPRDSPIEESYLATRAAELESLIADEALRDHELWGNHRNFTHTPAEAAQQLQESFFLRRREYLEGRSDIPDPHGATSDIEIRVVENAPTSGREDQQYIELHNNEAFAVDITGWNLRGATQHTFKAGTVIPANSSLYLVAKPTAFKARTEGPRGGQKLLLQTSQSGTIDQVSGEIVLWNATSTPIASNIFASEILRGDINADGEINANDIDALRLAIREGATDSIFDLDENQTVDDADFDVLVHDIAMITPGDVNFDGTVSFADFLVLSTNFGQADRDWADGNFDLDSDVTFTDFLILSEFFGSL